LIARNQAGVDILEALRQMTTTVEDPKKKSQQKEKTINDMQGELSHFQKTHQTQLSLRANVLEPMDRRFSGKNRETRNGIVHGACLLTDLDIIYNCRASQHKDLAVLRDSFEYIYGLSVTKYQEQLKTAPEEIVKTLNGRGDMKILHAWIKRNTRFQMTGELWMELRGTYLGLDTNMRVIRKNKLSKKFPYLYTYLSISAFS
jgi:hypothetical protein